MRELSSLVKNIFVEIFWASHSFSVHSFISGQCQLICWMLLCTSPQTTHAYRVAFTFIWMKYLIADYRRAVHINVDAAAAAAAVDSPTFPQYSFHFTTPIRCLFFNSVNRNQIYCYIMWIVRLRWCNRVKLQSKEKKKSTTKRRSKNDKRQRSMYRLVGEWKIALNKMGCNEWIKL